MKSKTNLVTARRVTALLLCIVMLISLVNITTIGFADQTAGHADGNVSVFQQLGTSQEMSGASGNVRPGDAIKYTIQARVDVVSATVLADDQEGDSLEQSLFATQPTEAEVEKDDVSSSDGQTTKSTVVITADLPKAFEAGGQGDYVVYYKTSSDPDDRQDIPVKMDSNTELLNYEDNSTTDKINITVNNVTETCDIFVGIAGSVKTTATPGSDMVFKAQATVDNAAPSVSTEIIARVTIDPVSGVLKGKVTTSGYTMTAGEFKFNVTRTAPGSTQGVTTEVSNAANGEFIIYDGNYTEAGEYCYTVTQKVPTVAGATKFSYETSTYVVTVVVSNVDGALKISSTTIQKNNVSYTGDITFMNTVAKNDPEGVSVTLGGKVSNNGKTLKGGEFTFKIEPISADVRERIATQAEEVAPQSLDEDATVEEQTGPDSSITDSEESDVTSDFDAEMPSWLLTSEERNQQSQEDGEEVSVQSLEDDEETTTPSEEDIEDSIEQFEDSEEEGISEQSVETGEEGVSEQFVETEDDASEEAEKELFEEDVPQAEMRISTPPMPASTTASNDAAGNFTFGTVTYDNPGTYTYRITQTSGGTGVDTKAILATVTVNENQAGDALTSQLSLRTSDGQPLSSVEFYNTVAATTTAPVISLDAYQAVVGNTQSTPTKSNVTVQGGSSVVYSIRVANTGDAAATGMYIYAPVPSGMTVVDGSIDSNGQLHNGVITWYASNGSFQNGMSATLSFRVTVPSVSAATSFAFQPYCVYTNNPDGANARQYANTVMANNNDAQGSTGNVSTDGLEVTLTQARNNESAATSDITVYEGDTIHYTIMVRNRGTNAIDNIQVSDYVPQGLTVSSNIISSNGVLRSYSVLWNITRLEAGASMSFSFDAKVDAIRTSARYENVAQAYPQVNTQNIATSNRVIADGYPASSYDDLSIEMLQSFDTYRNATDQELQVKSGDEITYYIVVNNTSRVASTKVTVVDEVPSGLSVVSRTISDDGYVSRGKVTWELDSIPARGSVVLSFSATIPNSGTYWDNYATMELANSNARATESNSVRASINGTSLSVTQTQALNSDVATTNNLLATAGDTITYAFTVTNALGSTVNNVVLTDVIPTGLVPVQGSASNGGVISGNTVTWNFGNLTANSRYTVTVQVIVQQSNVGTSWSNIGTVSYGGSGSNRTQTVQSNQLVVNYSATAATQTPNTGTTDGTGNMTGTMGSNVNGDGTTQNTGTTGTGADYVGDGTTDGTDPSLFAVGGKIPQTGGFKELHLWVFLFVVSGGSLLLMAVTGKTKKRVW